ncbi:MAG: leucine-rich repeat protein [Anaerovoracaceae bacterium]
MNIKLNKAKILILAILIIQVLFLVNIKEVKAAGSDVNNPMYQITYNATKGDNKLSFAPVTNGYDCFINWGDGTAAQNYKGNGTTINHKYAVAGEKVIKIYGSKFGSLYQYGYQYDDNDKPIKIFVNGSVGIHTRTDWSDAFSFYWNLEEITGSFPTNITKMSRTFCGTGIKTTPALPTDVTDLENCFERSQLETAPSIPSTVTNLKGTFDSCGMLKVAPSIPAGVTDLSGTFSYCRRIKTNPTIPSGVTTLYSTFSGCSELNSFTGTIPNTVENMEETFQYCEELITAPEIPAKVENLTSTFKWCQSLKSAPVLPNGITGLSQTFSGCEALTTTPALPSSVTNLNGTFEGCENIASITGTIPTGVTTMENTFAYCKKMVTAPSIPNKVENINGTFRYWEGMTVAPTIPNSVTTMNYTFESTKIISAPTIPANVKSLEGTFRSCFEIVKAPVIPDGVTNIAKMFDNTKKIKEAPGIPESVINMEGTFAESGIIAPPIIPAKVRNLDDTFLQTPITTAPTLPQGITKLNGTFNRCRDLEEAPVIPKSVVAMNETFMECDSLIKAPVIPENVEWMKKTFMKCYNMTQAPIIPKKVREITMVLAECSSIEGPIFVETLETNFGPYPSFDYDTPFQWVGAGNASGKKVLIIGTNENGWVVDRMIWGSNEDIPEEYWVEKGFVLNLITGSAVNKNETKKNLPCNKKFSLINPILSGYKFAGWYKDSKYKVKATMGEERTGTITYRARFAEIKNSNPLNMFVANAVSKSSTTQKLSWTKDSNATGYLIYRGKCAGKDEINNMKLVKTINKNSVLSYTSINLGKKVEYVYKVESYKLVNGIKQIRKTTPNLIHIVTHSKTSKKVNPSKIKYEKLKKGYAYIKIKKGQTVKKTIRIAAKKGKTLLRYSHTPKIQVLNTNENIALAKYTGKNNALTITGLIRGSTTIYCFSPNGIPFPVNVIVE